MSDTIVECLNKQIEHLQQERARAEDFLRVSSGALSAHMQTLKFLSEQVQDSPVVSDSTGD